MDVWFYHLQRQPLEKVLPTLLEKSLERGWRVVVQAEAGQLAPLDDMLWSYAPESFLPHGLSGADQPILLTSETGNENSANIRIFADADVVLSPGDAYERVIVVFDGNDELKLAAARKQWAALKAQGHALAYWQQTDGGGWKKMA